MHVHLLIHGRFWPQKQIADEWLACTGDSSIVDIRSIPNERAIAYVTKYIGKAVTAEIERSPSHLDEALRALKSRRLLIVTGEWYGHLNDDDEDDGSTDEWIGVGYVDTIIDRARKGDNDSQRILGLLGITATAREILFRECVADPP